MNFPYGNNQIIKDLAADLEDPRKLIYTDYNQLKTIDMEQQNLRSTVIAGGLAGYHKYKEETGELAIFGVIEAFLQVSINEIVVLDTYNHVIRLVNKLNRTTRLVAGRPETPGEDDGSFTNCTFTKPYGIRGDPNNDKLYYVTQPDHHSIRVLDLSVRPGGWVTTIKSASLHNPRGLVFAGDKNIMYISGATKLYTYNIKTGTITNLTASHVPHSNNTYSDGPLHSATFGSLNKMIKLNADTLLVSDGANYRLRVIDLRNRLVSSICRNSNNTSTGYIDGVIDSCTIREPKGITNFNDTTIFFTTSSRHVHSLTGKTIKSNSSIYLHN